MRQKMKFGGGIFAPPQGYYPQNHTDIGFGMSGPQGLVIPSFWVPFADLGSGVVDTTEIRTNATPTSARATTAWTRGSNGFWLSVASGSPRSYYDASGVYRGYLSERATTNRCIQSRDLSNVAWVSGGGGVSGAKTQTGLDGVTNSCSLMTASGADGTLLQTITSASATRTFSAWVKRSVGTGTIEMTLDGGTGWTDVTSQLISGSFARLQMTQAAVTNPVVGFRIHTSGDAFIVDMCQEESSVTASSPYPATTVAVTRNIDSLTYPTSPWFNATEGSFMYEGIYVHDSATGANDTFFSANDGTANERIQTGLDTSTPLKCRYTVVDGGAVQVAANTTTTVAANTAFKAACLYATNDFRWVLNNGTAATDTAGTLPTVTTLNVGSGNSGTEPANGAIKNLKYFNRRLSNSQLQALTA